MELGFTPYISDLDINNSQFELKNEIVLDNELKIKNILINFSKKINYFDTTYNSLSRFYDFCYLDTNFYIKNSIDKLINCF